MSVDHAVLIDEARSIEDRVDYLLGQMTLDEKLAQLGSHYVYEVLESHHFSEAKAGALLRNGIGHITRLGGASNLRPQEAAVLANQIQRFLIENTRLRIPAIIHEECCSGYMTRGATVFPQAIGVASTWDPDLVEAMADVIRAQMRSVGAHHALAPVLDIARDARWGRVEETFGEDPYLTARLGTAYIKGIQGDQLSDGVAATAKHFVGYGMSEGGLNWAPPHIGWRELREVYLFPFEAAVRGGDLASLMNAYHELDGIPCGVSRELLTDILRDQWQFEGTVVSDYFTVNTLYEYHRIADSKTEAAMLSLEAGIDVELPFTDCYGDPLREAVLSGRLPETLIDQSVRRVLAQKFALGLFKQPYVEAENVAFDTPEQRQLARTVAHKSIVLLRNEGDLLPLDKPIKSIAVIGPNADNVRHLFGDYAYPAHIETLMEARERNVFNQPLPDSLQGASDFIPAISVLDAFKARLGSATEIHYAQGCDVLSKRTDGFAEAVAAAQAADVTVLVMGDKAGLTDDCTSGEARDRADLQLPGVQSQLVKAICETGKPVVLVLINGRPVSLDWIAETVPAIVEAWFPSEEGANAIVDVLFGDVNPGGKLPITFPRSVGQVPIYYGHKPSGGRSHWKQHYVDELATPLYPFGFGLSYTRFEFSGLRITPEQARAGERFRVQVDITNVGERAGDEVVQLYTRQEVARITRPVKELKAFKRLTLAPKQTGTVEFELSVNQLGFYDEDKRFVVMPGEVQVMVGSSSEEIRCCGTLTISGEATDVSGAKVYFSRETAQ